MTIKIHDDSFFKQREMIAQPNVQSTRFAQEMELHLNVPVQEVTLVMGWIALVSIALSAKL